MKATDYKRLAYDQVTEKVWQDRIIAVLKANGWRVFHMHNSQKQHWSTDVGFPDTFAVHEETIRMCWIEAKTMKGRLGKGQKEWLGMLGLVANFVNRYTGRQVMYVDILRPNQYDRLVEYAGGKEPLR